MEKLNKCDVCGLVFEIPKEYCTEEEIFDGCPDVKCQGTYEEVIKCDSCNEWKPLDEIYKGICCECAEGKYTDRLGLDFIDKHQDYYLEERGIIKVEKEEKESLVEDLRKVFLERVDMDGDWNHKLEHLKEYVLDDMDEWIEFLKEEI